MLPQVPKIHSTAELVGWGIGVPAFVAAVIFGGVELWQYFEPKKDPKLGQNNIQLTSVQDLQSSVPAKWRSADGIHFTATAAELGQSGVAQKVPDREKMVAGYRAGQKASRPVNG